jgi:putative nucleotidyltransferase with HDIG domain
MDDLQARLNQPLLKRIITLLPAGEPIYLVGGAVRDALLNRQSYDLDFVTAGDAMKIARKLADELGAAYFPLDPVRKVARLILKPIERANYDAGSPIRVDFSAYQGADLIGDLEGRDFTINAMAVEVHQLQTLVDPTGGAADLIARRLRSCSPGSFLDDPVRILRAVRFSVNLQLNIVPQTLHWMREATPHLTKVSPERLRDELFRILVNSHPGTSLRILDKLNALEYFLPEVSMLKEVQQSQPHVMDAWNHTLDILNRLESLLDMLGGTYSPEKTDNLVMGLVALHLGRYREHIAEHLSNALNPDRPHRGLIFLAGLYHDVGKKKTRTVDAEGKIKFIGHDQIGSKLAEQRGQALKLSNLEIDRLVTIVNHHMRPSLLSHPEESPSRKAVYHFFRDTGAAGVDICILSLADILATYGHTLPQDRWVRHLEVVQSLLGAWWEDRDERVFPDTMINGSELMEALELSPGPQVGYLLESIREAQINHEIHDQQEAISLARRLLQENINKKTG